MAQDHTITKHRKTVQPLTDIVQDSCNSVEIPVQCHSDLLQFSKTRCRAPVVEQFKFSDDFMSDLDTKYSSSDSEIECSVRMFVKCCSTMNGKRVYDKRHYCMYCDKSSTNLSKHLLNKHKTEDHVQEIMRHPMKSLARKLALEKCRNFGDFHHNCEVIKAGEGEIIPWRSPPDNVSAKEYVPCPCC